MALPPGSSEGKNGEGVPLPGCSPALVLLRSACSRPTLGHHSLQLVGHFHDGLALTL